MENGLPLGGMENIQRQCNSAVFNFLMQYNCIWYLRPVLGLLFFSQLAELKVRECKPSGHTFPTRGT